MGLGVVVVVVSIWGWIRVVVVWRFVIGYHRGGCVVVGVGIVVGVCGGMEGCNGVGLWLGWFVVGRLFVTCFH